MSNLLICVDRKDFPAAIAHSFFLPDSAPVVLCGSLELLKFPRLALLNSRQSPRLERTQSWISKTLEVLHTLDPRETVLISSLGTPAWDFLTWAGGRCGFPLILVFPAGSAQSFNVVRTKTTLDFGLDPAKVLAIRPVRLGSKKPSAEDGLLRDRWVAALADRLIPVALRPGGNLDRLLQHSQLPPSGVERSFQVTPEPPPPVKKPLTRYTILLPEGYEAGKYLIHWTHSCVGPYPGEARSDYFDRVLKGESGGEGGRETLERILKEGVIRASTRLVRGNYPVVPFTERPPEDLPKLIRWRSGLRRWTFEPYGIALAKSRLMELGARPVIYAEAAHFHQLPETDRPFFQVEKSAGCDWTLEREWRVQGDVGLDSFTAEEMVVLAAKG